MPSYFAIFDDLNNPSAVDFFQSHVIRFSGNHVRHPLQQSRMSNIGEVPSPCRQTTSPDVIFNSRFSRNMSSLHAGNTFDSVRCFTLSAWAATCYEEPLTREFPTGL